MTVSEKLRLVQGLYSHAEMFCFHWDDGSDWTWHDVACKIADEVDAENAKLRERVDTLEWLLKLTLKYAEEGELGGYELCDLCDRFGTCENHPATSCTRTFDTSSDFIRDRMRELRVEAGE